MVTTNFTPMLLGPDAVGQSSVGRFFDGHGQVGTSERDCWIATFGGGGAGARRLRVRMDDVSRNAFLAIVEACVERACIPTLTDEFVSSIEELKNLSRSPSTDKKPNKAFFLIGESMFYNAVRPSGSPDDPARCDIAGMFDRGCERELWEALVRATFQMFFGTATANHTVEVSGGLDVYWDDLVTIYPFSFEKFRVADSGNAKGTGILAYGLDGYAPAVLRNENAISGSYVTVYGAEGTADAIWTRDLIPPDEMPTPWCRAGVGNEVDGPHQIRKIVEGLGRGLAGLGIVEFAGGDVREDMLNAIHGDDGNGLWKCIENDRFRNPWTRPETWTADTVAKLAEGPDGVSVRRSQVGYGTVQLMLACLRASNAVFSVRTMFTHSTKTETTVYEIGYDSGSDSIEIGSKTEEAESGEDLDGVRLYRSRSLGVPSIYVVPRIRVLASPTVDPGALENSWLLSEEAIVAACPGFLNGDTYWKDGDEVGSGVGMSFAPVFGETGNTFAQELSCTTAAMDDFSCYAQDVWPTSVGDGQYVATACLSVFERFDDQIYDYDLYGCAKRDPLWLDQDASAREDNATGTATRFATWWAETGRSCRDWASCAHAMASTWSGVAVQPTMPDKANLNEAAVRDFIVRVVSHTIYSFGFRAFYKSTGPSVVVDGVRYYPPTGYEATDGGVTTLTEAQTVEYGGERYFCADAPGVTSTLDVDKDDIWDGAVGISESYKIAHSDAVGAVEWAFKAAPNTPQEME